MDIENLFPYFLSNWLLGVFFFNINLKNSSVTRERPSSTPNATPKRTPSSLSPFKNSINSIKKAREILNKHTIRYSEHHLSFKKRLFFLVSTPTFFQF